MELSLHSIFLEVFLVSLQDFVRKGFEKMEFSDNFQQFLKLSTLSVLQRDA